MAELNFSPYDGLSSLVRLSASAEATSFAPGRAVWFLL